MKSVAMCEYYQTLIKQKARTLKDLNNDWPNPSPNTKKSPRTPHMVANGGWIISKQNKRRC